MRVISGRIYPERHIAWIVKNHLRVSVTDDELYEHARQCVRNAFDRAEDYTNRVIVESTACYRLSVPENGTLYLPTAPIMDIYDVMAIDREGNAHQLNIREWFSYRHNTRVELENLDISGIEWIDLIIDAGYRDKGADSDSELPGAILQAVMLIAGTFFEFSADTISGAVAELPTSAKALLQPYRISPYGEL